MAVIVYDVTGSNSTTSLQTEIIVDIIIIYTALCVDLGGKVG